MKQVLLLFFTFLLAAIHSLSAQSPPQLTVNVWPVTDAHVCGTSLVTVEFSNSGANCVYLYNIQVDLNPGQSGLITFKDLTHSSHVAGFTSTGPSGTSQPSFSFSGSVKPYSSVMMTMEVQYSCDFFDMLNQLSGYHVEVEGDWRPFACNVIPHGALQPFSAQSAPYNIQYSYVSPALNLPQVNAPPTKPFEMSIPLEIAGTYCDDDFTVILSGTPFCYDFSGASYSIQQSGHAPIPLPAAVDGRIRFNVSATTFGLLPFCANNYSGGIFNDLTLKIKGVKIPCGCMQPGSDHHLNIGITPCSDTDAPEDCKENGHVAPQISTNQEIHVEQIPLGSLTITNLDANNSNHFKICGSTNVMHLQISNNSTEPVYRISLNLKDNLAYNITSVIVGTHSFTPTGGTNVNLAFGHNPYPDLGLQDVNGDGIYAELAPGASTTVTVHFTATSACGIGSSDQCPQQCNITVFDQPAIQATVKWNDVCNTLSPPAQTTFQYDVEIVPIGMNVKYDGAKLAYNAPREVELDLSDGWIHGLSSGYMNNGPLHQYLCIKANLSDSCIDYSNLTIGGVSFSGAFNNGVLDLGVVDPDLLDLTNIQFSFSLSCCPLNQTDITFTIQIGAYFEDCPNCFITLACGDATFLSPCSGGVPGGACELFSDLGFKCYNDVYTAATAPAIAKLYPCDDLVFQLNPTTITQTTIGNLTIGFTVSDALLSYIATPYTYNGNISVNGNPVTFGSALIDPVANEPYSIIYFKSTSTGLLIAGNVISGSFKVRMSASFPSTYNKIDFFAPLMGYRNHGTTALCGEFKDVYGLGVSYSVKETLTASCESGGVYTISLIKRGGEFPGSGPDFPGVSRPVARFTNVAPNNGIKTTVNSGDPTYRILFAGSAPGTPGNLGNPYTLSANALTQPSGFEADGETLQTFVVGFEENCAGNIPVNILYDVQNRPGPVATSCQVVDNKASTKSSAGGATPHIAATFEPSTLGDEEWMWNNAYTLHTSTQNTSSVGASHAWIQLEYDPSQIKIEPGDITLGVGETAQFYTDPQCLTRLVINYPALASGETRNNAYVLHFLPGSCAPALPKITVSGFHSCLPFDAYTASCTATVPHSVCKDSGDELEFKFYDADLEMKTYQCTSSALLCEEFRVSVLLSNLAQGDVSDVLLNVDLPPGLQLLNAGFEVPGQLQDCALQTGFVPVDINEITGPDGWLIPNGVLPGVQSGATNNERDVHLVLTFRSSCGISPTADIVIRCQGVKPCGAPIERQSILPNIFSIYDLQSVQVNIQQPPVITYDCSDGEGYITFFVASINNLPPSAVAQITFPEIPGILFHHPGDVTVDGPGYYTTFFTNENKTCDFDLNAVVKACYTADCLSGHEVCTICTQIDEFTIHHTNPAGTLIIPAEVCGLDVKENVELTANVYIQDHMGLTLWQYNSASLICDENGNGIQDPGEQVIFPLPSGSLTGDGISGIYSTTFTVQAGAIMGCLSGKLLVVFDYGFTETVPCVCVGTAVGSFCCGCPVWDVQTTPHPTTLNAIDVNIPSLANVSLACVEVITNGVTQGIYYTGQFTVYATDGSSTCLKIRSNVEELSCSPADCLPLEGCPSNCCYDYCLGGRPEGRSNASSDIKGKADAANVQVTTSVQPNPFEEQFVLQVSAPGTEQVKVLIFDQVGNQVFQSEYVRSGRGEDKYLISLKDLPAGTYYLKVDVADRSEHHLLIRH